MNDEPAAHAAGSVASPSLSLRAVAAGSWGVVLAGGWWFVQRGFFTAG